MSSFRLVLIEVITFVQRPVNSPDTAFWEMTAPAGEVACCWPGYFLEADFGTIMI